MNTQPTQQPSPQTVAPEKKKVKRNYTPEQIEAFKERLAKGREKRMAMLKAKKEEQGDVDVKQQEATATPTPTPKKPITRDEVKTVASSTGKKKPWAKLVFYDKPDKNVKLKIGNKRDRKQPVLYESHGESSDEGQTDNESTSDAIPQQHHQDTSDIFS